MMHYSTYFLIITAVFVLLFATSSSSSINSPSVYAQYTLSYNDAQSTNIDINIEFGINEDIQLHLNGTQTFIMPRSVPSGYALEFYDSYVDNLIAKSSDGSLITVKKDSAGGPRWTLECASNETLSTISYSINLTKHEQGILSGYDASKIRQNRYIGILGYSTFGYLEPMDEVENLPLMLIVQSLPEWPIHLTLPPTTNRVPGQQTYSTASGIAKNYYHLADTQVFMGPSMNVTYIPISYDELYQQKTKSQLSFDQNLIEQNYIQRSLSFYVVIYTEDTDNLDVDMATNLSVQAMKNLLLYYNNVPFSLYTVAMEMTKPLDDKHSYGISMEHLNSCTINIEYGSGIHKNSTKDQIRIFQYNLAHHIQHAWLPKRLFSKFYYPFIFELTPVIDTIWFNEGFGQYIAMDAMARALPLNESYEYRQYFIKNRFEYKVNLAPLFIKQMPLPYLSMIASSLFSIDVRTTINVNSRGALMAKDMDELIQLNTQKQKSLRDGIIYMLNWSESNSYIIPFTMEQFPKFFMNATNVDVSPVLEKWLQ
ncbi:unnamed protein product [Rotaria sordida]|uniref:Peptidase M61 N-terminal domain-containing protein n=1 Tax=Rotaria sordida TaxID=392033 RepID=A0A819LNH2_9BILA|nr:unnamed protein product [Rotaria sordida]CAF3967254.1 unnamed protein product [Rotaria sordida]